MVFWVWFALNRIPNETLSLKIHKFDGVQSDIKILRIIQKVQYKNIYLNIILSESM